MNGVFADKNYGALPHIVIKRDENEDGWSSYGLLKFSDLPVFDPSIASVMLRLYLTQILDDYKRYITVSALSLDRWEETTVTWNNMDLALTSVAGKAFDVSPSDMGTWMEIDISHLMKAGDKSINLLLQNAGRSSANNIVAFGGKQYEDLGARLVLSDQTSSVIFHSGTDKMYCIDLAGAAAVEGTNLALMRCDENSDSQQWQMDGFGTIWSTLNSTLCLGVENINNRTVPALLPCNDMSLGQKWTTTTAKEIKPRLDPDLKTCIDLKKNQAIEGENVHLWPCHGGFEGFMNQQWFASAVVES